MYQTFTEQLLQIRVFLITVYFDNIKFNNINYMIIILTLKKTIEFIKYIFRKFQPHSTKLYINSLEFRIKLFYYPLWNFYLMNLLFYQYLK